MTRDSEKALDTIRRARRHVKRPSVVQASNGMEEALASPPKGVELRGEVWRAYETERRRLLGLKPLPPARGML